VTWDDHEVDNDYAAASPLGRDPEFLRRRTAAYRAYFEHMPLRSAARPRGSRMSLHARYDFGGLVRFHLLDGRQYRSPQACRPAKRVGRGCRERQDAGRTMLGAAQERWLRDGLAAVPGRWNLIAQASLMARASLPVGGEPRFRTDPWDGYPAARRRLLRAVSDPGARSCVVLSGDAHTCFVSDLKTDFSDRRGPVIATELCSPSLTSDSRSQSGTDAIVRANPHIAFGDSTRRGYFVVDLTTERLVAQLRVLDDVARPDAAVSTAATFEIVAGRPGVTRSY
jgi:alkaline phosphatase D